MRLLGAEWMEFCRILVLQSSNENGGEAPSTDDSDHRNLPGAVRCGSNWSSDSWSTGKVLLFKSMVVAVLKPRCCSPAIAVEAVIVALRCTSLRCWTQIDGARNIWPLLWLLRILHMTVKKYPRDSPNIAGPPNGRWSHQTHQIYEFLDAFRVSYQCVKLTSYFTTQHEIISLPYYFEPSDNESSWSLLYWA